MSLQVQHITKKYGDQFALNDVSFTVPDNEIVGFIGPNGAGKSTMMKIICGILGPDSGEVFVDGLNVKENSRKIKHKLGYLPENNPLYLDMYVKEYLEFAAGISRVSNISQKISNIIDLTGLGREQKKKVGALSKGYKQRVGIAQALIADPDILILDEPTTGLDPNQIIEIRNLISEVGKDKTVMLSTHIMQEVEAICKRVIIIDKGTISADNKTSEIGTLLKEELQTVRVEFDRQIDESALSGIKGLKNYKKVDAKIWLLESSEAEDIRPVIFKYAVDNGLTVLSMQKENKTLEEVFQILTNK